MLQKILENEVLPHVQRPARYLGTEWNAIRKDWEQAKVRMVFAFPDLYEVGMSHLGLHILYGLVNQHPDYLMERVFAPAPDMEEELRKKGLPLFSLESWQPLNKFDVIGFTLQYELTFTNILNILDLSGIPFCSRERTTHPLVIAGGPVAFNPEPVAAFFDCVVIGEGEEVLLEILEALKNIGWKRTTTNRMEALEALSRIPGVYVPSFYQASYDEKGRFREIQPIHPAAPQRVTRRVVKDLNSVYFPVEPIVPFAEAVHERGMVEVFRGCTRGCRFCQAGMIYRPVRERNPQLLLQQAENILKNTGYEEISLVSLSSLDYSQLESLLPLLREKCRELKTGINLPSLRVDSFSVQIAHELPGGRKASLTFAPEAGTQRLRNVINKGVTEEDLLEAVRAAFEAGWQAVKLYFMVGLPTETREDLEGIAELVRKVGEIGKRASKKKPRITISASSFVPKPHTPFQWEAQNQRQVLQEKHKFLQALVRKSGAVYNWHNIEMSFLEAVLARGDRKLAPVIASAWKHGCRFDGWTEHFRFHHWEQSFREHQLDPEFYALRKFAYEEPLPWDHIDTGITKEFLIREHQRALAGEPTLDCRNSRCEGCGICQALKISPILAKPDIKECL
jgi:radical SAM family uncharacterized protein